MKTAVEWLVDELKNNHGIDLKLYNEFNKAKEIENEQLNQNKMILHIVPINDLKEHTEESTCECGPEAEILENGDIMIIHNAYDGRE